jgi:hypothetical protein
VLTCMSAIVGTTLKNMVQISVKSRVRPMPYYRATLGLGVDDSSMIAPDPCGGWV